MSALLAHHRVGITGMGLVSPLGRDLAQVWARVMRGHSGIRCWNGEWGGSMSGRPVALAQEHREEPRRAIRFAWEAARDALQDAGLHPLHERSVDVTRFGVAVGNSKGGVLALEKALVAGAPGPETMSDFFHHSANAEIMNRTGICGPCVSLVSACSTGTHNIVQGMRWIKDGEADHVLAGASESSLTPLVLGGFQRMGVLAQVHRDEDPRAVSRPYDRARSGFVVGEGAGVLLLERLSSALRRGARIHGEITGWGFAADAYKPVSLDPTGAAIERAALSCAKRACVAVAAMDYINCHGTGTRENDTIESRALRRLLGSVQRTALSSTKPMTGHLLGAAGSVELILTVLAMLYGFVPPTLNLEHPDPQCDLDFTPGTGREKRIAQAMSLSYGFGGHVAAIAVGKT